MALTIAKVTRADHVEGNKRVRIRDITLDSSYPTGGYTVNPSDVGLRVRIDTADCEMALQSAGGATCRTVSYNYSTGKLQVYTTGSAEAAAASDQSAYTVRARFVGA